MVNFLETSLYWQGGFTEDQQKYYNEYRLSQKGKYLWEQIDRLKSLARNLCSTYDESWCFNESFCCRRHKHLPFQCDYNDNETLAAYAKGNYDFGNLERIEDFFLFLRVPMKLLVIFKMMMLLVKLRIMLYLVIALNITMIILISLNFLRKLILQNNLLPFRSCGRRNC